MSENNKTRENIKNIISEIDNLLTDEQKKKFDDIRDWANGGEYKKEDENNKG